MDSKGGTDSLTYLQKSDLWEELDATQKDAVTRALGNLEIGEAEISIETKISGAIKEAIRDSFTSAKESEQPATRRVRDFIYFLNDKIHRLNWGANEGTLYKPDSIEDADIGPSETDINHLIRLNLVNLRSALSPNSAKKK